MPDEKKSAAEKSAEEKTLGGVLRHAELYVRALGKWLLVAVIVGLLCGVVGSAFHISVLGATDLRKSYPWLLWCLPLAGLLIAGIYRLGRVSGLGTNAVIDAVHQGKSIPPLLLPAIFIGTVLTHLCGGSAGREGAALQMGGDIGRHVGQLLRLDDKDRRLATICGMSGFFSALFGTPLSATVFALEVISVGEIYYAGFVPCLAASLVAYGVSLLFGLAPTRFSVSAPALEPVLLLKVAVLGILCALVSILLCEGLHRTEHLAQRLLKNSYLRIFTGGVIVIALTYLCGTTAYNGAGMEGIIAAVEQGTANPWDFLLKLLFTAVTIGCGFKGGEVVPTFFIGATFGCAASVLLGIPAGFGGALGLVAVFCGAVNCPMASLILSIELFGADGLIFFAVACSLCYMLSGYRGLYSSQTILYSKLKAEFINVHSK